MLDRGALLRANIPKGMTEGIDGWLTGDEEAALYTLGRLAPGPVLEVGPWLGRSTVCIARGIQDSGTTKPFTTCELDPTAANWVWDGEVWQFYPDPDQAPLGASPKEEWQWMEAVVSSPGGVIGKLHANLARAGVASLVAVVAGDFHTAALNGPYGFIFADVMHTPDEIHRNAPRFAELAARNTLLACHDSTPENREALGDHFTFSDETTVDTLFAGIIERVK
ncbi:MAG: class I SAM-dependent methyltransferase [Microthrixaceae bacterium]